jgi:hypothetical protein
MFDADAVDCLVVWEYQVKSGGKVYATRAPQIGELARLQQLSQGGASVSVNEIVAWVSSLFSPEAPKIEAWQMPHLAAFMQGYTAYFFAWSASLKAQQTPKLSAAN